MFNKSFLAIIFSLLVLSSISCSKSVFEQKPAFERADWQDIYHHQQKYDGKYVRVEAEWYNADWYSNKKDPNYFVFYICTRYAQGPRIKCEISSSRAKVDRFVQDLDKTIKNYSQDFTMDVKGRVQNGTIKISEIELGSKIYDF